MLQSKDKLTSIKLNNIELPKHVPALDFLRTFSIFAILIFHFNISCGTAQGLYIGNSTIGIVFVSVFFMLSGFLLNHTTHKIDRIYWWKRFCAIFPCFWFAFLFYYLRAACENGSFFYLDEPAKLILSVFGMDHYFTLYGISGYANAAEWFLGAIILLYLLYPFLRKAQESAELIFIIVIIAIYVCTAVYYRFADRGELVLPLDNTFSSSLLLFCAGMTVRKHKNLFLGKKFLLIGGLILVLIGYFQPYNSLSFPIMSFGVFLLLYLLGSYVMKLRPLGAVFAALAAISYCIFLIHHPVIYDTAIFYRADGGVWSYLYVLIIDVLITVLAAWALFTVGKAFLRVSFMEKLNDLITGKKALSPKVNSSLKWIYICLTGLCIVLAVFIKLPAPVAAEIEYEKDQPATAELYWTDNRDMFSEYNSVSASVNGGRSVLSLKPYNLEDAKYYRLDFTNTEEPYSIKKISLLIDGEAAYELNGGDLISFIDESYNAESFSAQNGSLSVVPLNEDAYFVLNQSFADIVRDVMEKSRSYGWLNVFFAGLGAILLLAGILGARKKNIFIFNTQYKQTPEPNLK